jgi:hypothetical protein
MVANQLVLQRPVDTSRERKLLAEIVSSYLDRAGASGS